ncbi:MAG: sugar ABC transporter permease [Chloroflexota bacterium]
MKTVRAALFDTRLAPYVFLLPFLAIFVVFRLYPAISAGIMSFQDVRGTQSAEWIGLENYESAITNLRFSKALGNTVLYTLGTLLVLIPVPLVLAALLDSGRVVKQTLFRVSLFLPALTSLVVVSVIFRIVLARDGLLNTALGEVGVQPNFWLEAADLAVPSMILMAAWRWTGINIIYFSSGLVNVPKELYEAAALDGASAWRVFRSITLPMIEPTILFVVVLSIIGGFQVFVEPLLLWSGGNSPRDGGLSVALLIYKTAFTSSDFGQAAAIGIVLAAIIVAVSLVQFRFLGGRRPIG